MPNDLIGVKTKKQTCPNEGQVESNVRLAPEIIK